VLPKVQKTRQIGLTRRERVQALVMGAVLVTGAGAGVTVPAPAEASAAPATAAVAAPLPAQVLLLAPDVRVSGESQVAWHYSHSSHESHSSHYSHYSSRY
jgi:hypothetical protein